MHTYKICIYANTAGQDKSWYVTLAFQPLYICIRIRTRLYAGCIYENTSRPGQIMVRHAGIPTALEVRVFHELFFVLQVGQLAYVYVYLRICIHIYGVRSRIPRTLCRLAGAALLYTNMHQWAWRSLLAEKWNQLYVYIYGRWGVHICNTSGVFHELFVVLQVEPAYHVGHIA